MQGIIEQTKSEYRPIGYIKIGRKITISKNGKEIEIPESLDYFIADGNYKSYFDEAFGEKPNSIEIMFLSDNFFESFWERYEIWKDARRWAYGDGNEFKVYDEKTDSYLNMDMTQHKDIIRGLNKMLGKEWDTLLSITFLIPAIHGVWGLWRLNTKGKESSIPAMKAAFLGVQKTAGSVIGIPFDLQVKKVISNKPNSKSKYPVLQLVANISQGHLEKVRNFINNKNDFLGLLTEQKIDDISLGKIANQIEYQEK